VISDLHFAPTDVAKGNLVAEGIPESKIFVTGNTVIDALLMVVDDEYVFSSSLKEIVDKGYRIILVTVHRRENFGRPLLNICRALRKIANAHDDVRIVIPVHRNPNVKNTVYSMLGNHSKIRLLTPLVYDEFANTMNRSYLILTDSGGIQEEAPSLGKPVFVLREKTERPEAIKAGTARLVGTDVNKIVEETNALLRNRSSYNKMAKAVNPYGDGKASERIVKTIDHVIG
jgi:UDP-N-acetylglucosamine 2-epimerase (non-hydrolysing)